jgi:hypothetical protein
MTALLLCTKSKEPTVIHPKKKFPCKNSGITVEVVKTAYTSFEAFTAMTLRFFSSGV